MKVYVTKRPHGRYMLTATEPLKMMQIFLTLLLTLLTVSAHART